MDQSQPTRDPQDAGIVLEGDTEQQGKKSLLHKVKGKARKIKGTVLSKRSHGHDDGQQDHDLSPKDDGSEEFYEDDDEEMDAPEIHGAPIYDSPAVTGATAGKGGSAYNTQLPASTPPASRDAEEGIHGLVGKPITLEEDPNVHGTAPANYQSKVTDPTGAGREEMQLSPMVESFGKLSVGDEKDSETHQTPRAGTTDGLSPTEASQSPRGGSYSDKLSYAASAITGSAISAKNVVASKLGYGGGATTPAAETKLGDDNYGEKEGEPNKGNVAGMTEKLAPVYDKVASAGTTITSKVPGTGVRGASTGTETNTPMETDTPIEAGSGANKGYVAAMTEKFAPVYDKVAGAGTTIKSKVPGTGTGAGSATTETADTNSGVERGIGIGTESGTAANKGYTAGMTEKLSPVYNKVSSAGTTIMSKFTGSGAGTETTEGAPDKKGASVTEYLSEKTKPCEDDKALSDTIAEALYLKSKASNEEKPSVKESDEVAKVLGTGDKHNSGNVSGELKMNSGGNTGGVVDKVKSWFGKGNEDVVASSPTGETAHGQTGERRLQESSN